MSAIERHGSLVDRVPVGRFICHSSRVTIIAAKYGWLPGARYTNLRDVRRFERIGLLDIDWVNYSFKRHLAAARETRPLVTVAQDIQDHRILPRVIEQAFQLSEYSDSVVIVPKDPTLGPEMEHLVPARFVFGYAVRTKYGGTKISPKWFRRPVHILGGRPDVQRRLADLMIVVSLDCNRFTLDAGYGDYFDGRTFKPHPVGGYERCIEDSIKNINRIWRSYARPGTIAPRGPSHDRT